MNFLAKNFFRGLLFIVPIGVTGYVVYLAVTTFDRLVPLKIPGAGLALVLASITLIGFLGSNVVGGKIFELIEKALGKLPVVKLLYSALRDLLNAFVGDRRNFSRPVSVAVTADHKTRVLGFVTCERFDDPQLRGHVAVYVPQSYNFAGNLIVVPKDRVKPIDADGAQFLAFIVSGGVTEMNAAQTLLESPLLLKKKGR